MRDHPHGPGRQHAPAELFGPTGRIGFDRQVERRLLAVGDGDVARHLRAVILHPPRHQPLGRVEQRGVDAGQLLRAVTGDAAQHRVDQRGKMLGAPVGLSQAHRHVDRGVVGSLQQQNLGGAQQQRGFDARRIGREAAVEIESEDVPQCAEAAQHRTDEVTDQRTVPLGERHQASRLVLQLLVERPAAAQHTLENSGGDLAGIQTRRR